MPRFDLQTVIFEAILLLCLAGLGVTVWGQMETRRTQTEQINQLKYIITIKEAEINRAAADRVKLAHSMRARNRIFALFAERAGVSKGTVDAILSEDPYGR